MYTIQKFKELYNDMTKVERHDFDEIYHPNVVFIDPITRHTGCGSVYEYIAKLSEVAESCRFVVDDVYECHSNNNGAVSVANWTMTLLLKRNKNPIIVEGTSQLKFADDKIIYQRDFYDLGDMVYERIPLLGWIIRKIKGALAS